MPTKAVDEDLCPAQGLAGTVARRSSARDWRSRSSGSSASPPSRSSWAAVRQFAVTYNHRWLPERNDYHNTPTETHEHSAKHWPA